MTRRKRKFSQIFKNEVAKEYLQGQFSLEELAFKYGLCNASVVSLWVKKYRETLRNEKIALSLQPETGTKKELEDNMARKVTPPKAAEMLALEQKVAELEKKLKHSQMRYEALETLVTLAEQQGIPVRKKCGVKQ